MKKEEDFYFSLLKYAAEKISTGFTDSQIEEELKLNENSVHKSIFINHKSELFQFAGKETEHHSGKMAYYLKPEAFFRYNELLELREAREASSSATKLSLYAIGIALISMVLSAISLFL